MHDYEYAYFNVHGKATKLV